MTIAHAGVPINAHHVYRWKRRLAALAATLTNRHFWLLLAWVVFGLGAGSYLMWLAVTNFDTAFRMNRLVCTGADGEEDRRILVSVFTFPFFIASVLAAIGELWLIMEHKARDRRVGWAAFLAFSAVSIVLGTVLLMVLRC